jgi:riboflavin kinase / FMN adenylyltransferase
MRDGPRSASLPPDVDGTVLTVGTFDGVHRGHQDVLSRLVAKAADERLRSLLVTFDPHPLEVVNPAAAPSLLTVGDEKLEVLAESGIDYVAIIPFTKRFASYDAARFVDEVLIGRYRVRHLLMGHDHGFGRNRAGDESTLRTLGASRDFTVEVVEPVVGVYGQPVSSTAIRRAVAGGDLEKARDGLGRPYAVGGRVVHGEKRGRLLRYPTINIPLPPRRKLLPPEGVYVVEVQTPRGPFGGMLNFGGRPTFGEETANLEAHLFDAEGDFYDMRVRIDFIRRLRDTKRFESVDALMAQLRDDEVQARSSLGVTR